MEWLALIIFVLMCILGALAATACDLTNVLRPRPFAPPLESPQDVRQDLNTNKQKEAL
jgi:hypothetical protein